MSPAFYYRFVLFVETGRRSPAVYAELEERMSWMFGLRPRSAR